MDAHVIYYQHEHLIYDLYGGDMMNCPNCGALITGDRCEYCGTIFQTNTIFNNLYHSGCWDDTYYRLNISNQIDRLEMERRNLEYQLALNQLNFNARQAVLERCYKRSMG